MPSAIHSISKIWYSAIGASVAVAISYWLFDQHVQQYTASLGFRGDIAAILAFIGFLGHGVFCFFVAISLWFLDPPRRKLIALIVAAVLLSNGITLALKSSIYRPRPAIVAGLRANVTESVFSRSEYQSFPSGHTTTAFALATSLAFIYPHARWFFWGLAALVGFQRIVTQAHYPSDVFAGAAIALITTTLVTIFFSRGSFGEPLSAAPPSTNAAEQDKA